MNPLNELILKWHHFLVTKRCRRKVLFDMGFRTQNRSGTSFGVEKTYIGVFKIIRCIKLYRLGVKNWKFFDKTLKSGAKNVKSIDAISLKRWHYFFLNSANKIEECKIKPMTIGVLTRIPSGTIFDKIGTKNSIWH